MKFNIINGIKSTEDLNSLLGFFRCTKGRAYSFRFKDWSDFKIENQLLGWGDGESTRFQLMKTYAPNENTIIQRKITLPLASTIKIYLNNEETNNFTLEENGVIKFNQPIENNVKINGDFEFDIAVRFNSDLLEITMDSLNSGHVKDIMLIECI